METFREKISRPLGWLSESIGSESKPPQTTAGLRERRLVVSNRSVDALVQM